jgi:Reverse transcriptase (RNA-dependent DNA polymerase)
MSLRTTRSQEDLAGIDEADLYRTPPDTKRRANTKKPPIQRTPSDSNTEHEEESPLGRFIDETPRPPMARSIADEEIGRLQEQLAQAEATILDLSQSANPDEEDRDRLSEIELQQQENERARQHELEMAKLQLQIEQAKAANSTPAAIQITQRENRVAGFKKEVTSKNLKMSFKLEGSNNYESWRDEALTQALAIKAKHTLINKETTCPADITDDDERKIWEVKSETIFDILLAGLKPAIRQIVKGRINEDNKNAAELWTALETEYRIHAADTRMELVRKFATATIDGHNIQSYISQFRDTCGRLKHMGFEIPIWLQNDRFIDGLKGHQSAFIRAKRDEIRDPKDKGNITELDLNELMDQLIARAIDYKDNKKAAKALKAEEKPNEKPGDSNKPDPTPSTPRQGSTPPQQPSTRNSRPNRGNNQQDNKRCGYCGSPFHDEPKCRLKNHTIQSEEWQTINASAIQYWKQKNEGKTTSSKPRPDSIPSTPTPNPNVGFSATAFSTTTSNIKDQNWYLDSGASYHMTPFRDKFTTFRPIKADPAGGITGHEITPQGIGTIRQHIDDQVLEIPNVRYIPNIVTSLVSYRQLEKQGFKIELMPMEDGTSLFEITDPQGQTFKAIPSASDVYPINGVINPTALAVRTSKKTTKKATNSPDETIKIRPIYEPIEVWHNRLGHLNADDIIQLAEDPRSGIKIKGSKVLPFCETCKLAGSKKKLSKRPMRRSHRRGEFLHIDTGGGGETLGDPSDLPPSFQGSKYFIVITDDATRFRWVFFIKEKSEIYDVLVYFTNHLLNQGMRPAAFLRSDWAPELDSARVQTFLSGKGIKWEPTTTYSPHQDGVSERSIQTILRRARCILIQAKLPKKLWAEAMVTAIFLTNISPTSTELFSELLPSKQKALTPHEAWYSTPYATPKALKMIGSDAYVHLEGPELKKAGKISARSKKMTLVGYRDSSTYRLYDREADAVILSSSVDLNESTLNPPPPPTTELVDNDPPMESDEDESSDASIGDTIHVIPRDTTILEPIPRIVGATPNKKNEMANPPSRSTVPKTRRGKPKQPIVDPAVLLAQELTNSTKSEPLTLLSLAKQDQALYEDPDIWFRPFRNLKAFLMKTEQDIKGIKIPKTYEEAVSSPNAKEWQAAMDKEIGENRARDVYTLVPTPKGVRTLGGKWVYTLKLDEHGEINRFKARWVVQGFRQRKGIEYTKTYAPVVAGSTVRTLFAVAAVRGWHIKQIDFITAFLNGILPETETVYTIQPKGYEQGPGLVCKLNQGLYGLKQAAKIWYDTLTSLLKELGFNPSQWDAGLWFNKENQTYITLYVDDVKLIGPNEEELDGISRKIAKRFQIKELGHAHHYLGMKVRYIDGKIHLSQGTYIKQLLEEYDMGNCNATAIPMTPGLIITDQPIKDNNGFTIEDYQSAVGSLQFLATYTRPDIAFATAFLARWNKGPTLQCWKAVKHVLRYLKGTIEHGILFNGNQGYNLVAYSDADWAGDTTDRKSTTGSLIKIADGPIYWRSTKQGGVSLSTTEAEYIAASETAKNVITTRGILEELGVTEPGFAFPLLIDNTGSIAVSGGEKITRNARHIDIRYHHIRDLIGKGLIEVLHTSSAKMAADGFTKALPEAKFKEFRDLIGVSRQIAPDKDERTNS